VSNDHNDHPDVGPAIHPQNIEQQPCSRYNISAIHEDIKDEIDYLRFDLRQLTESVKVLNNHVISSFEKLFKLLDSKATKKNGEEIYVSEDHDFVANVPREKMATNQTKSNVKANEGVIAGVSEFHEDSEHLKYGM
ncbi:hypothetical protein HAX54_013910, partial [Datura stramonium]|nr:hypothetical protein [Datura stramonium]